MNPEPANMDGVAQYWIDEAEEALTILQHLFERADYSYALFFGHLAVEKLLKTAYVLQKKEHAPPIHNLPPVGQDDRHLIEPGEKRAAGYDNVVQHRSSISRPEKVIPE